jgi:hypothetical protein
MIDLHKPQRAAWASHVKQALEDACADITRLSSGATRISISGNLIVVSDIGSMSVTTFNKLIHRSA